MKYWHKITLVVILLSLQCEVLADNEDCKEEDESGEMESGCATTKAKATHTVAATQTPSNNPLQSSTNENIPSKLSQTFSICKKMEFCNAILYLHGTKQKV